PNQPTTELYGDRDIPSLPKLLKDYGYTSLSFHGNEIEFWNRHNLYPALGFDQYYDEVFFEKKDVINWGTSDEVVYEDSFPILKDLYDRGEKFYAQYITLSSHHPFTIPADRVTLTLPEKYDGTYV